MGSVVNVILLIISTMIMLIAGGHATSGAHKVTDITNYKQNDNLVKAHRNLSWAAAITWILLAIIIVAIILMIVFIEVEVAAGFIGKLILYGFLFVILLAVIMIGVLSAAASAEIRRAKVSDDKGAAKQATIAAVLAIVGFVLILVIAIGRTIHKHKTGDSDDSLTSTLNNFNIEDFKKLSRSAKEKEIANLTESIGKSGVKTVEANPEILA